MTKYSFPGLILLSPYTSKLSNDSKQPLSNDETFLNSLKRVSCPTFLIQGDRDPYAIKATIEEKPITKYLFEWQVENANHFNILHKNRPMLIQKLKFFTGKLGIGFPNASTSIFTKNFTMKVDDYEYVNSNKISKRSCPFTKQFSSEEKDIVDGLLYEFD